MAWLAGATHNSVPLRRKETGTNSQADHGAAPGAIKKFSVRRSLPERSPTTPWHLARPVLRLVNIHRRGEAHSLRAGGAQEQMGEARLVGRRKDEAKGETGLMWPDYKHLIQLSQAQNRTSAWCWSAQDQTNGFLKENYSNSSLGSAHHRQLFFLSLNERQNT